jgi:hypothetical protein
MRVSSGPHVVSIRWARVAGIRSLLRRRTYVLDPEAIARGLMNALIRDHEAKRGSLTEVECPGWGTMSPCPEPVGPDA